MRAFLLACLAALVVGVGAYFVLDSYPNTHSAVFSAPSVRV